MNPPTTPPAAQRLSGRCDVTDWHAEYTALALDHQQRLAHCAVLLTTHGETEEVVEAVVQLGEESIFLEVIRGLTV